MSDARNSSGNIRGGGARITGGSGGRTQKNTGGGPKTKGMMLGGDNEVVDKRTLAKRNLQLLTMSKKLAIQAKTAALVHHTEAEYIELNVPIPDPDSAYKKLKAMIKFTAEWHDADFRERWLEDVLEVWTEELEAEFAAAEAAVKANEEGRRKWENGTTTTINNPEGVPVSIEELEVMLQDTTLTGEERKRLKNKLKKRRQKEKKKVNDSIDD